MKLHALVVLAGCSWTGVAGSGKATSETRPVAEFTEISLSAAMDAEIVMAAERRVELSGDDNLLPLITTEISGGRLTVGTRKNLRPKAPLLIRIAAPQITAIELSGSSTVALHGVRGDKLSLDITGSGTIRGDGAVHQLRVGVSGSGDVEAEQLPAERASVNVSGSGDVALAVSQALDVTISGSGTVTYRGDPDVKKTIAGSGTLTRR